MYFKKLISTLPAILVVISLLYSVFVFFVFPKWVVDDAFITFRYAENLAQHGELTWNVGEDPIEGYTGVALPVLLSGLIKAGFDPIPASHTVGVLAFFVGWLALFLVLKKVKIYPLIRGLTLLLYSTIPILFTHSLSGLETMLFLSTMLVSFYLFLKRSSVAFLVSLLLVSLVRPEGVLFSGLLIIAFGWLEYRYHREDFKKFIYSFLAVYLLPAVAYFLWRWNFYGQLLPNTYYAKRLPSVSFARIVDIVRFLRTYFVLPVLATFVMILPVADSLWTKVREKGALLKERRFLFLTFASASFVLLLILFYSRSHLLTNFSERFYVPLLPFFIVGFAYLLNVGAREIASIKSLRPISLYLAVILVALLGAYQVLFQVSKIRGEIHFAGAEKIQKETMHYKAGMFLHDKLESSEWLISYIDAGAIPYFSGLRTVDFGKLNDPILARGNLALSERVDYFFSKDPGAATFFSRSPKKVVYTEESDAIIADRRFENYILAKVFLPPESAPISQYQLLFLRKDIYDKLPAP